MQIIIPSEETIRRRRLLAWLGGVVVLPTMPAWAKILGTIKLDSSRDFFCDSVSDSVIGGEIYTFASEKSAEQAIDDICRAAGIARKFEMRAYSENNAAALVRWTPEGQKRFIFYGSNFMREMEQRTGTKWAPVSILAHEVGHHVNSHTLFTQQKRPQLELEADIFSGGVMQKLGANLDEAQAAMRFYAAKKATPSHPKKADRLQAIYTGWRDSCDFSQCDSERPPAENAAKDAPAVAPSPPSNALICGENQTCIIEYE